jgi:hypothetical protein
LTLIIAAIVLVAGIIISFVGFDTPERYWALLITLGLIIICLIIGIFVRSRAYSAYLERREVQLQRILDIYNEETLGRNHVFGKAAVYGSSLNLIFTVRKLIFKF